MFKKYNAFWGTSAYIVNKTGAKKFMDEFARRPITMQIDSKMSHMIQNGKLNVYGCNLNIIASSGNMGTDIQTPLMHMPNEDPFVLEDL
jgi:GR25 family glycosyltransferase involved in LPS biosynthesis